ncbi:MAG: carboxypeptidase regulatory-like domain-containing protein, partial [Gemmatimonadales bacterium]
MKRGVSDSRAQLLRGIAASAFLAPLVAAASACGGDGDTMEPPDTGAIQGSILDDISAPVTDLTVALRNVGATSDLASTLTDTLGGFGFAALDPADYDVTLDVPQTYDLNGQANPVTARVVAGVTTPVDFTLRLLAGTVTGVVSDTVAAPIPGATASLREPGTAIDLRKALSDSTGRYAFSRVPIGDYDLFMSVANGTVLGTNPERISVVEGDTVAVAFTVRIEPNPLGTWQALTPLGSVRTENSVAALDGLIYVVGGFKPSGGGAAAETAVERYDPSTDSWTTVAPLPAGVNHAGLAAVGGKLYLVGGYGGATFTGTDIVRIYDPATDGWTMGASLPSARGALAVAVLDGKIHAIGGSTNNGSGLT